MRIEERELRGGGRPDETWKLLESAAFRAQVIRRLPARPLATTTHPRECAANAADVTRPCRNCLSLGRSSLPLKCRHQRIDLGRNISWRREPTHFCECVVCSRFPGCEVVPDSGEIFRCWTLGIEVLRRGSRRVCRVRLSSQRRPRRFARSPQRTHRSRRRSRHRHKHSHREPDRAMPPRHSKRVPASRPPTSDDARGSRLYRATLYGSRGRVPGGESRALRRDHEQPGLPTISRWPTHPSVTRSANRLTYSPCSVSSEKPASTDVVTGSAAAMLHGVGLVPGDLDVTPAPDVENLARLASVLESIGEQRQDPSAPFGHWQSAETTASSIGSRRHLRRRPRRRERVGGRILPSRLRLTTFCSQGMGQSMSSHR